MAKFLFGFYQGNLILSLDPCSDKLACELVAKNALFCTIDVAEKVKIGELGSKENKEKGGNNYYSWYCCAYQRKTGKKQKMYQQEKIAAGAPDPLGLGCYKYDGNTMANLAIKTAIIAGLPKFLANGKFTDYMACHIWDRTCYNYLYHTSVINLVLLPSSIAGLSDYNDAVKELLQYEAARRFGCYPATATPPKQPKFYARLHKLWRQSDEHQKAEQKNITTFKAI